MNLHLFPRYEITLEAITAKATMCGNRDKIVLRYVTRSGTLNNLSLSVYKLIKRLKHLTVNEDFICYFLFSLCERFIYGFLDQTVNDTENINLHFLRIFVQYWKINIVCTVIE